MHACRYTVHVESNRGRNAILELIGYPLLFFIFILYYYLHSNTDLSFFGDQPNDQYTEKGSLAHQPQIFGFTINR